MTRAQLIVGLVLVGMAVAGVSTAMQAARWDAKNVPPQWRADRWELSQAGQRCWDRARHVCGEIREGAWIRFEAEALHPDLVDATPEQAECFSGRVAPWFGRDPLAIGDDAPDGQVLLPAAAGPTEAGARTD